MGQIIYNGRNYSGLIQAINPDCYSTEEREVGCWIDGKPLYQKTIDCGALPNNTSKTVTAPNNLEYLVSADGVAYNTNDLSNQRPLPFSANGSNPIRVDLDYGNLRLVTYSNWSGYNAYLTILYTKTTDTAGSGKLNPFAIPTVHYSENEQVIGTWIDGSTLYQKTIDCGALPNNTTKNVAHGISDMDYAVVISGSAKNPNNGIRIPLPYVYGNTRCLQTYIDATNIKLISTENMSGYTQSYVTLQYTKTS